MRQKRIALTIDLLNITMYFFIIFSFIAPFMYAFTNSKSETFLAFTIYPIMLVSYWAIRNKRNLILDSLIHAVLIGIIVALVHNPIICAILVVITLILFSIGIYVRIRTKLYQKRNISVVGLCFVVIGYFACIKTYANFFIPYITYGLLISCLLYCINMYFVNFYNYMQDHPLTEDVPIIKIKRTSTIFLTAFTLLNGILMLLFMKLPSKQLFSWIGHQLLFLFGIIINAIFSLFGKDSSVSREVENNASSMPDPGGHEIPFLVILQKILYYVVLIGAVVLIVALIAVTCYKIFKRFHKSQGESVDKREFINPFEKKMKVMKLKREKKPSPFAYLTNNGIKIRKHFYQTLRHKINKEQAPYYTSKEMTQSVNTPKGGLLNESYDSEDLSKLHTIYDKARYSDQECTKQDYKEIKKIHL